MCIRDSIYKGAYKGMYCTPCESFWTESQLVDGKCPDCGREVQPAEEEAYFFRLSKYAKPVRDLLVNTDFLEPRSRVNEMVANFIDPGLEDLCVSRTSFTWGKMCIRDRGMTEGWLSFTDGEFPEIKLTTVLQAKPGCAQLRHVISGEGQERLPAGSALTLAALLLPQAPRLYALEQGAALPLPEEEGILPHRVLGLEKMCIRDSLIPLRIPAPAALLPS